MFCDSSNLIPHIFTLIFVFSDSVLCAFAVFSSVCQPSNNTCTLAQDSCLVLNLFLADLWLFSGAAVVSVVSHK